MSLFFLEPITLVEEGGRHSVIHARRSRVVGPSLVGKSSHIQWMIQPIKDGLYFGRSSYRLRIFLDRHHPSPCMSTSSKLHKYPSSFISTFGDYKLMERSRLKQLVNSTQTMDDELIKKYFKAINYGMMKPTS
ncbi:unnamed protein product, partial [Vitis vinifera]